jgi:CRP-like cAMP-binding protein
MQLRRNAKIELLHRVPLFEGCSRKELGQISTLADEISVPAGTTLIKEGAKGREFFVLVDGTVDIRRKGRKLGSLDTGDFFGEIALLTDTPRSATVVTASPVRLLVIVGPAFRRLLDETPSIQGKVLTALARRVAPSLG